MPTALGICPYIWLGIVLWVRVTWSNLWGLWLEICDPVELKQNIKIDKNR